MNNRYLKHGIFSVLLLLPCLITNAQVVILNDNVLSGRMSEIKATVLDSLSK